MKRLLTILMMLHFYFALNAQSWFDTSYSPNGKIASYGIFDENKKHWLKYRFYNNGSICEIQQYNSPVFKDSFSLTAFNLDGSTAVTYNSFRGVPIGLFELYYSNGMIKLHGKYYNGFKSGKWAEYYPTGEIQIEYLYKLTKEDSLFGSRMTLNNQDFISLSHEQKIKWGEEDPSQEGGLRYINITHFDFRYLKSKEKVSWKKYDRTGKLIDSNITLKTEWPKDNR